ncbi:ABC transporter substrate-binding protein [Marasmitruncus massiliensis]|uniref:ABC transporter substrate-binding protein n=1 Tax=Marasmitruncus massiliensis TaxID=1944642 RepID=UPI000C7D049F|nr:ABC transporter substrate-binding protein [Marasmitruncus massiliensis]
MKKIIAISLAAMLALGSFAGCGGNAAPEAPASSQAPAASESSSAESSEAVQEPVTIRVQWWGGDDRHEATLKAIEAFQKKYDYITVEPEYGGWDGHTEKVNTQFAGGTAADVLQVNYDWIANLSPDGKGFLDLKSAPEIDLSNWDESVLKFGYSNGILNAIPVSVTGRSLYYNKSTFDRLGVEIPNTWDDLKAAGAKFQAAGENMYPFDLDTGSGFPAWYAACVYEQQKTGKQFITDDNKLGFTVDEIKDALDFYMSLEQSKAIRTQQTRMNDAGETALYQTDPFISGNVAGVLEWGSSIGKFAKVLTEKDPPDELVLGDLPVIDGAKMNGWFMKPSLLFAINAKTAHPKESALFLNYLLNDPEASVILGTSRGIPSSKSAMEALKASVDLENDLAFLGTEQIMNCNPCIVSPYMENAEMKEAYKTAVESVSYGSATSQDAAQTMFDSVTDILAELTA